MTDPTLAILSAIGASALSAAGLTALANYITKEREFYVDLSKNKIEAISKLKHYIIQLSRYFSLLANELLQKRRHPEYELNCPLCMYSLCNILRIHNKILEKFGTIQFDDVEAEDIINKFRKVVTESILIGFTDVEIYKLSYILTMNNRYLSYHEFFDRYVQSSDNNQLYKKFESWLKNEEFVKDYLKEVEMNSRAESELLSLELNQIYERWYKSGPTLKNFMNFDRLRSDIRKYLKDEHPVYFCRIRLFDLKWKRIPGRIITPFYRYYLISKKKKREEEEAKREEEEAKREEEEAKREEEEAKRASWSGDPLAYCRQQREIQFRHNSFN